MSLCSRSSSRQILMALCHPRCGLLTTNQEAMRSKGSSPYLRAGLLMLGPRKDSRHLWIFIKRKRVEVINIIRIRGTNWRRFCKRNRLQIGFTAASGLLERSLSLVTNQSYRGKLTRERKHPRKKDGKQRFEMNKLLHRGWPPDKRLKTTVQSRMHGSIAPQ